MPSYNSGYGDYGRSLADLIRQRGDDEARMYLQQGDAEANMWGQAGNAITNAVSGWQRNVQENRRLEMEQAREARRAQVEGMQIESAQMDLDTKKRAKKGQETARAILPLARRQDGLATYDRDIITREFDAAGFADQLPDVLQRLDEQDAAHMKVLEARRNAVGMDAFRVLQSGGDEQTYDGLLQYWEENDALPPRELKAMKELGKDPKRREQALMAAVQSSPTALENLKRLQAMQQPDLMNVPEGGTLIDKRSGKVIVQGKPKPPGNIEDAILQATDPAERQRLIDLKKDLTAAGRQPVQGPSVQAKSLLNDKGEPIEGYFDPSTRRYYDAQGQVIQNPRSASTRDTGRQITDTTAGRFAELDTSLDDVSVLRQAVSGNDATGTTALIGSKLPNWLTEYTGWGSDAKSKNAVIARVKQVIGKALEGGVLRKEDENKYKDILPTIGDPEDVVKTKIDGLEKAIALRKQRELDAREDAGYDVNRFRQRGGASTAQSGGLVQMTAPDGRELSVPADKVDEALKRGAKRR